MILSVIKFLSKWFPQERAEIKVKGLKRRISGKSLQLDQKRYRFATQFVKNKRVLNIACGYGKGCSELNKGNPVEIYGVDNDETAIRKAKEGNTFFNVHYFVGDARKIPFEDDFFDAVVSIETLEHLDDQFIFLRETRRVLREEGVLVLSTPNKHVVNMYVVNPYHINLVTAEEAKLLLMEVFGNYECYLQNGFKGGLFKRINLLLSLCFDRGEVKPAKDSFIGISNIFIDRKSYNSKREKNQGGGEILA